MKIDADLDGGAIRVLEDSDAAEVILALRPDRAAGFMQWFHFRVTEADEAEITFRIINAVDATYAAAFEDYRVAASYDGERWFRVDTAWDGETITIRHTPSAPTCLYAYFAAYPWARHLALVERAQKSPRARVDVLGHSVEGRPLHGIRIGDDDDIGRRHVWILARQHPGETMGGWFMEGVLARLLDPEDPVAQRLLEGAVFHLVPLMNPDGAVHGNQRTNARGRNLNREWLTPSLAESPEVLAVRAAILASGVDLFLDVHGDEETPYVFAAGCEGNPGYSPRLDALEDLFMSSLMALDADFQRRFGYDLDEPGQADLSIAASYVGERFDCLSLTLEMPFKDAANNPDPERGWSPERAAGFGGNVLGSVLICLDSLR